MGGGSRLLCIIGFGACLFMRDDGLPPTVPEKIRHSDSRGRNDGLNGCNRVYGTQYEIDGEDSNGMFVFSDKFADGTDVPTGCPWVSYLATYPVGKKGQSIYAYMLVRSESQKAECEKTLTSLGE
jgi:hypothetical protein